MERLHQTGEATETCTYYSPITLLADLEREDGCSYPAIDTELGELVEREYEYHRSFPVFFGHYWCTGKPIELVGWNDHAVRLDFSAGRGGALVACRWNGESTLQEANFVTYPEIG